MLDSATIISGVGQMHLFKMIFAMIVGGACITAVGIAPVAAHSFNSGLLHIEHPWTRVTPPGARTAAFYLEIENKGDMSDRLLSVEGDVADQLSLHNHIMDNGIARMRPVDGIEIPAKGKVSLKPGGLHIMATGMRRSLTEMDRVSLTLIFKNAGRVQVEAAVEPLGKKESGHNGMHDMH
jgi:hypothetical protein